MKNSLIYIFIILLLLGAVYLFLLGNKYQKIVEEKESIKDVSGKPLSNETQTVIIDASTGDELIVSDFGEDNVDMSAGTDLMVQKTISAVTSITERTGRIPEEMEFRVYSPTGEVLGNGTFLSAQYKI